MGGSIKEALLNKRMLICIFNGFTAGLPLYYVYQLVPAWLRDQEVDLKTIGLFGLLTLPYTFKLFWAPVLDRVVPPFLGRRRGWMVITQLGCMLAMMGLGAFDPTESIDKIVWLTLIICIFSASQDVVLDAYRRELLPDSELGLGSTFYQNAYRVAGFIPGGLGIALADYIPWSTVHLVIGLFMLVGVIHTLVIKELDTEVDKTTNIVEAYFNPFLEFFKRDGLKNALYVLAFMFCYKLGDTMATALQTPFFLDMQFSKTEIGSIIKLTTFWSALVGSFVGGVFIYKYGINKSLWVFGFLQWMTIYGFAWLSMNPGSIPVLVVVLTLEYLAVGLGTSAFMAFIAKVSSKNFSGTQLAMFSALFGLARSLANATTGYLIEGVSVEDSLLYPIIGAWDGLGWTKFFFLCGFIAIPGMLLLLKVAPWNEKHEEVKA